MAPRPRHLTESSPTPPSPDTAATYSRNMRSSFRWLVPVAVAATVTGGAAINSAAAGSAPQLPTRTPQQVLEAVASSDVTALSGTVVTRTSLGLPALPQLGGAASSSTTDVQGLV